jgi:threonine dehydratase
MSLPPEKSELEGAAAALAGALKIAEGLRGKRVGLPLSGGNVDRELFAEALAPNGPSDV